MSEFFLGINYNIHDAAAAIVSGHEIIAAAPEERFDRQKHSGAFPISAIRYCLDAAAIDPASLGAVGYFWQPSLGIISRIGLAARGLPSSLSLLRLKGAGRGNAGVFLSHVLAKHTFNRAFRYSGKFLFLEHHLCHAATAFYPSPFDEAAILTMDLSGERATSLAAYGFGERISKQWQINYPDSLGSMYATITQYLGFGANSEESLVMGLAAYGQPKYFDELHKLVDLLPGGQFRLDRKFFVHHLGFPRLYSPMFEKRFGPARKPSESPLQARFCDMAASIQKLLEKSALHIGEALRQKTKSDNLCIGGGVALNAAMNHRFVDSGLFKHIYVGPSPGESGSAIGAALISQRTISPKTKRPFLRRSDLGPTFTDGEVEAALSTQRLAFERCEDPARTAARHLSNGHIIGWFQGRMEFGPRALGNRSILAEPNSEQIRDLINERIKFRHAFRPFGASVKVEACRSFFEIESESEFMMQICKVKAERRSLLRGVTHIDGTSRPQTVNRNDHLLFWLLLDEYEKLSGLPVLLNTSFNLAGEPIVCSPADAVRTFLESGLDALVIGHYIARKSVPLNLPPSPATDSLCT
jgi:carbamoyltransferase